MNKRDIVILAGKGHEVYQEINGVKNPFDEREIVKEILEEKK
jgi:UDP-N-acetylmuramoyl-L-alanyl-D-glutamate--2,6-diaminopimelate ligase